jgi:hypothetical protein
MVMNESRRAMLAYNEIINNFTRHRHVTKTQKIQAIERLLNRMSKLYNFWYPPGSRRPNIHGLPRMGNSELARTQRTRNELNTLRNQIAARQARLNSFALQNYRNMIEIYPNNARRIIYNYYVHEPNYNISGVLRIINANIKERKRIQKAKRNATTGRRETGRSK